MDVALFYGVSDYNLVNFKDNKTVSTVQNTGKTGYIISEMLWLLKKQLAKVPSKT